MPCLSCSLCVLRRPPLTHPGRPTPHPDLAAEYTSVEVRMGHRFRHQLLMAETIDQARL
jgi:hypothetical protein